MVDPPEDMKRYYHGLVNYVQNIPTHNARISMSIQKLSKFSLNHLKELSCDIFDEINRRKDSPQGGHLPPRSDIHQKRNNARYQFGDLSTQRFGEMCHDVIAELNRRYPSLPVSYEDIPVPEIPPLHRTRTLGKNSANANSPNSSNLCVPVQYQQVQDTASDAHKNMKNIKQTEVIPTKSSMAGIGESDSDSQSDYEYYNPDLSETASVPSSRQNSTASAASDDASKTLSTSSKNSFNNSIRTPFEERLAASSGLGFGSSTTDFHFGIEEQLIDSRTSRLPPATDNGFNLNLDELNGIDRSSVATMRSPLPDQDQEHAAVPVERSSPVISIESENGDLSYLESPRSYVSNGSLGTLENDGPKTDLVEYISTLEDQVKELELLKGQAVEENQQLHNMLADTENERKLMEQEVATLRESSEQPPSNFVSLDDHEALKQHLASTNARIAATENHNPDNFVPMNEHQSIKDQWAASEAKVVSLERQLEDLLSKHSALSTSHDELNAKFADAQNVNQENETKHATLSAHHDTLQDTHRDLQASHDKLQESQSRLQDEHGNLLQQNADLQQRQAEFDANSGINVASLTTEHESLLSRYSDLQTKHNSLDVEHKGVKSDYSALNEAFMDLQTRYAQLQNAQVEQGPASEPKGLNIANLDSDEKYDTLLAEHKTLLQDLERQREITEQVRQEAKKFLLEMRQMTDSKPSARIGQLQQDLEASEQQVEHWKGRYQKLVDESRTNRTQNRESMLLQIATVPEGYFDVNGLIGGETVQEFQDSITELLYGARNFPETILDYLHSAVIATEALLGEVAADDTRYAKQTRLVIRTANQLISSVRNFSESAPLFPIAVVVAASSDLSYAACEFMKVARVRPEELLKYRQKEPKKEPRQLPAVRQTSSKEFPRPPYSPDVPVGNSSTSEKASTSHDSLPTSVSVGAPQNKPAQGSVLREEVHQDIIDSATTASPVEFSRNDNYDAFKNESLLPQKTDRVQPTASNRNSQYGKEEDVASTPGHDQDQSQSVRSQEKETDSRRVSATRPQSRRASGSQSRNVSVSNSPEKKPTAKRLSIQLKKPDLSVDVGKSQRASPIQQVVPHTPSSPGNMSKFESTRETPKQAIVNKASSPITPKIRRGSQLASIKADSTIAELQAYLEEQTSETVDSIRELLSGIKVDAVVSELKPRVDSIVYYVDLMVTTTGACMKRTENWLLKDKGSFILQNLDDCCQRMSTLRENLDHFDADDGAPRALKQRLAGVSFDMAKCTKELVKTVEDVSLKNQLETIDARLRGSSM